MKKLLLLLVLGSAGVFGAAFQNGGFESPVLITSPDFATVPTGWSKVDPTASALFMETYATFGLPLAGGEGNQAYGFGGNGGTTGSLSQTFDSIAGATYHVSFQYVVQQGFEFEDLKVDALNVAIVLATNSIRFNNIAWVTSGIDFVAAASSTTLRFSDITGAIDPGVGNSTNWALDRVTVTQTAGPPRQRSGAVYVRIGHAGRRARAAAIRRNVVIATDNTNLTRPAIANAK